MFKATFELGSIFEITPQFLADIAVRGLILDIDNTLTTHDNPTPADGILDWLKTMRDSDIKMIILSNNTKERVRPFADLLCLPFVFDGKKPLKKGFLTAADTLHMDRGQICAVGDQIFTDILGANMAGIKSILVPPFEPEKTSFFKFKRFMEKPFRKSLNH